MLKAIIVDDESRSIETLNSILQQFCADEVIVVGTAASVDEAQQLIKNQQREQLPRLHLRLKLLN